MRKLIRGWRMTDGGLAGGRVGGWFGCSAASSRGREAPVAIRRLGGWMALLLAALALPAYPPTSLAAQSLDRRLDSRLEAAPWNRNLWGIAVVDERGRVVYEQNADKLFVPASNTKLVVSAVAAALLPGD